MIDLSVELVELLKHADVKGKKLTWNLQVNASAVTVKMIWIKAEKPVATIGEVTSQAPKKKHLFHSRRKRNVQLRLNSKPVEGEKESSRCQHQSTRRSTD
jgi:hypothetical protein